MSSSRLLSPRLLRHGYKQTIRNGAVPFRPPNSPFMIRYEKPLQAALTSQTKGDLRISVEEAPEGHYKATADIRGFPKENVHLQVRDRMLKLAVSTKEETKTENLSSVSETRIFSSHSLPVDADVKNITAEAKDGKLEVLIPKKSIETEQPTMIDIK